MGKFVLSEPQKQFVEHSGSNVLVSASAGSGKTTTMIEKILDLVVNKHIPLNKLLIVTYTKASASELKVKLYNKLSERISKEDDLKLVDFLNEQLENIETSEIGTVHSVCKKIIKKYFYAIEQDTNFILLDSSEEVYLFGTATANVFNKLIGDNDDNFYKLYSSFNSKRNTSVLEDIVRKIYLFLISKVNVDVWVKYVLEDVYNTNLEENICVKFLQNKFKKIFIETEKNLSALYDRSMPLGDKYHKYIDCRLNFCKQVMYTDSFAEFCSLFSDLDFVNKPVVSKNTTAEQLEFLEDCEVVVKQDFANAINACKQFVLLNDANEMIEVKQLIGNLFDLVKLVVEEYEKLKLSRGALDFSDLEHKTLQILSNDEIRKEISDNYEFVFIDEYQDINEIQERILSLIGKADNINMIGDVKQSIYQFRLSNPKLFLEKYSKYLQGKGGKVIELNENYRSDNNILQFVNFICNSIITPATVGINYAKNAQLIRGGENSSNNDVVCLDIIDSKSGQEQEDAEADLQNDRAEGILIAQKVVELLGKEYMSDGVVKKLEYKDIAILLRSKTQLANEVYSALKELNIPCSVAFNVDIFKSSEVEFLYSLLKILSAHNDDISSCVVLKSYIFKLCEDDFVKIRQIDDSLEYCECINKYAQEGDNEGLKEKLNTYYKFIDEIRFYMLNHTIVDTLEYVLEKYKMQNYYFSLPDGVEKTNNIKEFLRLVGNTDFEYNLPKCLDYLKKIAGSGVVMEMDNAGANAVKIMTLHSSKGLEFPAVIYGGMGKNFLVNHFTNNLIINDNFGVGVKYLDAENRIEKETLTRTACKYANEKDNIDEEIRLLYVGLTRAKNFLCCTGTYNLKNILVNKNKGVYACRTYLDLIFKSFSSNAVNALMNKQSFVINENEASRCKINVHQKSDLPVVTKEEKPFIFNKGDKDIIAMLKRAYAFEYPFVSERNVPIKNSVSSILKEENDYENSVFAPKKLSLFEGKQNTETLLEGTMYHEIMEQINYTQTADEIEQIIQNVTCKSEYIAVKNRLNKAQIFNCVEAVKKLAYGGQVLKEVMFTMQDLQSNLVEGGADVKVIVQGVIDLIIKTNKHVYIVDFKTNKHFKDEDLINTYGTQLSLYAKAYEKCYNQKVDKLLLYSFTKNKFIEVPKKVVV